MRFSQRAQVVWHQNHKLWKCIFERQGCQWPLSSAIPQQTSYLCRRGLSLRRPFRSWKPSTPNQWDRGITNVLLLKAGPIILRCRRHTSPPSAPARFIPLILRWRLEVSTSNRTCPRQRTYKSAPLNTRGLIQGELGPPAMTCFATSMFAVHIFVEYHKKGAIEIVSEP